ncbi:uncharacterized protein MKK02DRAFT_42042 [Dioszegia hungarica]|uniref:Uncharacterized protein n=1 Tax=Dioszegia hungarica TaxID=4972 RepID=A0AA38HCI1_9TREE|nr:uncharacterized protein MKK02DRAFT_42042 [Dioszegia hungarica]KAI9639008.1 hypothetical protein MKK02DRAFT_42042 [Dioszegia hungarica]
MAYSPAPSRAFQRRRGVIICQQSPMEMMMAVPGLLRRMMTFASKETLCACVRVSWDWFDDAVAVLYNQMEVRVALGMGSKLQSPRFMEYNSVVRQVTQTITSRTGGEAGPVLEPTKVKVSQADAGKQLEGKEEDFPFVPTDTITIGAAADAAPLLFPAVHSVVSDLPPGLTWGEGPMRKGGDRSFLSFTSESGQYPHSLYIERCIGISTKDPKVDPEVFQIPSIPDFVTELSYTIVAHGKYNPGEASIPLDSILPVSKIRYPVKSFRSTGIDVHIRTLGKIFTYPMLETWPFEPGLSIDCDQIVGMGIKEFRALATCPALRLRDIRTLRLDTVSAPTSGACLHPADVYPIRDIILSELPYLDDLTLSFVVDEDSETAYTDTLLPDLPTGPLRRLTVRLWSKSRPGSSKSGSRQLSFPFNFIRRLAACLIEGGSLVIQGRDLPNQNPEKPGMDLTAAINWIRGRPLNIRRTISTMDYSSLGIITSADIPRICYDYGSPMTLPHSLTFYFTSDLLSQIDRYLRDPSLAPRPNVKTPTSTLTLISTRAAAFELNNHVMEAHWKGMRTDKDTLATRAAKLLWECKNAGMNDAPTLMTQKYPTLFEELRRAAQTAQQTAAAAAAAAAGVNGGGGQGKNGK